MLSRPDIFVSEIMVDTNADRLARGLPLLVPITLYRASPIEGPYILLYKNFLSHCPSSSC